ncbi:Rieske (2Fe-2S) protein [Streptomyces sp. NPDC088748]|uniref:Rieske (2Fe-2S) protein n=1 Tax=Streptomyces sp. NPDC088748 TaxID=3365887 RepID=UPI003828051A
MAIESSGSSVPASFLDRRDVLKACGGLAVGAAVTGCVIQQPTTVDPSSNATQSPSGEPSPAQTGGEQTSPTSPNGRALAAVSDIPKGGGVVLGQENLVISLDETGKVTAFSATCTHQGCAVNSVSNGTINCPCHGSKFDCVTGKPVSGPATRPLSPVKVEQRGDSIYRS